MSHDFNVVSVIGLGYIGLPTAAMIASRGIEVVGVDVSTHAVDTINRGQIHIVEPELDALVAVAVAKEKLRATTRPVPADVYMIAVPTPFKGDHEPDVSYVEAAATSIAPVLRKGNLVILESTSPVGTTRQLSQWLAQLRPDLRFPQHSSDAADVNIAYCPERVLPGRVVQELVNNDRVIGGITPRCSERAVTLYRSFVKGECVSTDSSTAEMCKLTENSFRDVNIAFANELSIICERLGIDVWELIRLANRHPRVKILQPGPGVGGHCIAVDPWFIVSRTPDAANLIRAARIVNDSKPQWVLARVHDAVESYLESHPAQSVSDVTIACLGLAFKPDIDDLRESPALEIVHELSRRHAGRVLAVEPHVDALREPLPGTGRLVSLDDALEQAQIIVLLVGHSQFKALPKTAWDGRAFIIDACGLLAERR